MELDSPGAIGAEGLAAKAAATSAEAGAAPVEPVLSAAQRERQKELTRWLQLATIAEGNNNNAAAVHAHEPVPTDAPAATRATAADALTRSTLPKLGHNTVSSTSTVLSQNGSDERASAATANAEVEAFKAQVVVSDLDGSIKDATDAPATDAPAATRATAAKALTRSTLPKLGHNTVSSTSTVLSQNGSDERASAATANAEVAVAAAAA
jgi:hypothetical protein